MVRIGTKLHNVKYTKRPGAYAIIERDIDNKIGIATNGDYFFLGGGIEAGETELEALEREMIEESGYSIKNIKYFNTVNAWILPENSGGKGPLDVKATFYTAEFDKKITEPIEKDHRVLWVDAIEYKDKLYHEYQRYILKQYINTKNKR